MTEPENLEPAAVEDAADAVAEAPEAAEAPAEDVAEAPEAAVDEAEAATDDAPTEA